MDEVEAGDQIRPGAGEEVHGVVLAQVRVVAVWRLDHGRFEQRIGGHVMLPSNRFRASLAHMQFDGACR